MEINPHIDCCGGWREMLRKMIWGCAIALAIWAALGLLIVWSDAGCLQRFDAACNWLPWASIKSFLTLDWGRGWLYQYQNLVAGLGAVAGGGAAYLAVERTIRAQKDEASQRDIIEQRRVLSALYFEASIVSVLCQQEAWDKAVERAHGINTHLYDIARFDHGLSVWAGTRFLDAAANADEASKGDAGAGQDAVKSMQMIESFLHDQDRFFVSGRYSRAALRRNNHLGIIPDYLLKADVAEYNLAGFYD